MTYNFDEIIDRRNTESAKWNYFEKDILPLWVADMDLVSPEPVIKALQERVDHRIFGYPYKNEALEEAVLNWVDKRHGWKLTVEDLIFIPGVITGFNLVAHALADDGQGALLQTPAYPPFFSMSDNTGTVQQEMELIQDENGKYTIDFEKFENSLTEKTKLFMLCNPQNPTGRVFTKEELTKMAEICQKKNVVICSDEIHSDLIFNGSKHIPIASLSPEISNNTITLIAPSKTFNIAGLKASVLICTDPEKREKLNKARMGLLGGINLLGQVAAQAAYAEGEPWLEDVLAYLEKNRDFAYEYVNEQLPGVKMWKPEGTYLAWLDCREAGIEGSPAEFFKEKAKVGLNPGEAFGKAGEGFVRLNFGCPKAILEEALEKMKNALLNR